MDVLIECLADTVYCIKELGLYAYTVPNTFIHHGNTDKFLASDILRQFYGQRPQAKDLMFVFERFDISVQTKYGGFIVAYYMNYGETDTFLFAVQPSQDTARHDLILTPCSLNRLDKTAIAKRYGSIT